MSEKNLEAIKAKFGKFLGYATWVLIVMLLISTIRNINRVISIRKQVESERIKVEKMKADNAKLVAQINETQGSDFIEKQIRDKLGLTKSGEAVVVLPDESVVKSFAPPSIISEDVLPDPNWRKWMKLFF